MDLKKSLQDAKIIKIAIIDDDLSNDICTADLLSIDGDVAALLGDPHDPDYEAYIGVLTKHGLKIETIPDLATPLSDKAILEEAPTRLSDAVHKILEARHDNAAPVRRVLKLLEDGGLLTKNIDFYSSPLIPADKFYDLIIVDYYLVRNSNQQTLPFIDTVITAHKDCDNPLQVILMSTHVTQLQSEFRSIRPLLKASSSRMRIMGKPMTDDDLIHWKTALHQLASDRPFVSAVEDFVSETSKGLELAARDQANKLWELDLQAMDILHETATLDNDDFCRYVEECISRHLLTALESYTGIRSSLRVLGDSLMEHRNTNVIAPVAEIGDSRAAIRGLMRSMEWRGGPSLDHTTYPAQSSALNKAQWLKKSLRFGMVLRSNDGTEWLNLTQACDLAQAKEDAFDKVSLLLISGVRSRPLNQEKNQAMVYLSSTATDTETEILGWNLRNIRTPSIQEFAEDFVNGWSGLGELRLDQAQSIAATYSSRASRVGLQRRLSSWHLQGTALLAGTLSEADPESVLAGTPLTGHAMSRGNSDELHIDRESMSSIIEAFPASINEELLRAYMGVQLKAGNKLINETLLIYCKEKPSSMRDLKFLINHDNWLSNGQNKAKLVLAVWHA
ncbi:hypothetical protein [Pseudomonas xantholysinigenes]|uniref:Response receiver domain-containing protein n=1 Tax=Pseudomonas xantholysinigenes TaxID=2745490 RepID=A0A9E6TZV4_9PSED|nr:hypothetical protein [Pseudomonas xantholysinigenes]QXI40509.1 hypothetical protein HU772_010735 [Pseudomonas xantholysinigenes]